MILTVLFTICIIIMMPFAIIISFVYTSKIVKPYYDYFIINKWYPYKKKIYAKFISKISTSDPEIRIKKYKKIEKIQMKLEYLNSKLVVDDEEIKPTINKKQVDLSDIVLQHINDMIAFEITNYLRENIILEQKFEILKLDEGIKKISKNVKDGLSESLFNTPLLYTNEYIMNYIVNKTFTTLSKAVTELNRKIEIGM